jgi:hypothetical protein
MVESLLHIILPNELKCLIGVRGFRTRLVLRHRTAGDQQRDDAEKSAPVRIEQGAMLKNQVCHVTAVDSWARETNCGRA